MNTDRSGRGLRRSIDDSADELGEKVAGDLPASAGEIRRQLPGESLTEATGSDTGDVGGPLRAAIAESPVGDVLE